MRYGLDRAEREDVSRSAQLGGLAAGEHAVGEQQQHGAEDSDQHAADVEVAVAVIAREQVPRNPPTTAPTIPMSIVTTMPPGSFPGINAFAIAPATSPRMTQTMMLIRPPNQRTPRGRATVSRRE